MILIKGILILFGLTLGLQVQYSQTISERYDQKWNDPEIRERIEQGIEMYRKGWATLEFVDHEGRLVKVNGGLKISQISHDFLFGANIFMLDGFEEDWKNNRYEGIFRDLLNYATVPFYWSSIEPEPGRLRFDTTSEFRYRRPPPDLVAEFCEQNDVTMKGHPLFWGHHKMATPRWFPSEEDEMIRLINRRFRQIADRYRDRILHWDVINEANQRHTERPLPLDYPVLVFDLADRYFNPENHFTYNFTTDVWMDDSEELSLAYLLTENLILKGSRVDAIGLQIHFFNDELWENTLAGEEMTPQQLYRVLDLYGRFGLPLQVTEITFPSRPFGESGEAIQARVTRDFYRLWFSHPSIEAITWWNIVDGTASGGEDRFRGGFLRENMSPKPAYEVLNDLINSEWKISISEELADVDRFKFNGFYGTYEVSLKTAAGHQVTRSVHLDKNRSNEFQLMIPQ